MANPFSAGQFCWCDLNSKNSEDAMAFYSSVFGWSSEIQDTQGGPPYAFFTLDGKPVAGIGQMSDEKQQQGLPSIWTNYIQISDCHASCQKLESLGGKLVMPPMDAMEAGTMAIVQDSAGAMFALWQAKQNFGAELVNVPNTMVWNELATRNFDDALTFYGALFGWTFHDNPDSPSRYKIIQNNGQQNGGIMEITDNWDDEIPSHWTVYFAVAKIDDTTQRVKAAGGQIVHGPFDAGSVGRLAICSDPHGGMFNAIELSQPAAMS
jgi:predicted enzyme related to lactoylglutathione lyase